MLPYARQKRSSLLSIEREAALLALDLPLNPRTSCPATLPVETLLGSLIAGLNDRANLKRTLAEKLLSHLGTTEILEPVKYNARLQRIQLQSTLERERD